MRLHLTLKERSINSQARRKERRRVKQIKSLMATKLFSKLKREDDKDDVDDDKSLLGFKIRRR